jgi:activator of Hsp90 ATPase-like protein
MSFSTSFTVDRSAREVFEAVTNVRGWWTGEIEGTADTLGAEFTYRYPDLHDSRQRVTELVPDRKVVWRVTEAHLSFVEDPGEWTGTEIVFEIVPRGGRTEVRFTHEGLRPSFECFDQCSNAWGFFVNGSLRGLVTTGKGPATPPWEAAA